MKKIITYFALSVSLAAVSCSAPDKSEVEKGFNPKGELPEVSIEAKMEVFEYEKKVVATATFSGITEDAKDLEIGFISSTDKAFVESKSAIAEKPADGRVTLDVPVVPGKVNYIMAMAASADGAVYSDMVSVKVPDIPWYYKIAEEYVGTFDVDTGGKSYENHKITIVVSDDKETLTVYDIDPYVKAKAEYVFKAANYATGAIDHDTRTVTFTMSTIASGLPPMVNIAASPYFLLPITGKSEEGYTPGDSFVMTFNEDATEISYPCHSILDGSNGKLPEVYSLKGTTLKAN